MREKLFRKIYVFASSIIIVFIFHLNIFAANKITILYTNSLNGYLDDCHCKENPRGGLVMRAAEIRKIKTSYKNILLFETGDFFAPESDELLIKYLIKGYKYIGYDYISVGDQEFSGGIDLFMKYSKNLPFICNNISIKYKNSWKSPFKRNDIIEKNKIKIGIIGTMAKHSFKYYPKNITKNVKISDQIIEIKKDIKSLKNKNAEYIFLLSHSGYDIDKELARKINGINLIIGGHSQTLLKKPVIIENTIIVQAGADGARIGILELESARNRLKIIRHSFSLPHLPKFKEDKFIRKLIVKYNAEVKKAYKKVRFD